MTEATGKPRGRPPAQSRVEKRVLAELLRRGLGRMRGVADEEFAEQPVLTAMTQIRDEYAASLPEDVAAQPSVRALIDLLVRDKLLLDSVDLFLLRQGDLLVDRQRRRLWPMVGDRARLADAYAQRLTQFEQLRVGAALTKKVSELEQRSGGHAAAT